MKTKRIDVKSLVKQMFNQISDDEKLGFAPTLFIMSFTVAHPGFKPQSIDRALRKCKFEHRIQLVSNKDTAPNITPEYPLI